MSNAQEYKQAIEQAKINLEDIKKRGEDALGSRWSDIRKTFLTPEERAVCDLKSVMMTDLILAREEMGVSRGKPEKMNNAKQPIAARAE